MDYGVLTPQVLLLAVWGKCDYYVSSSQKYLVVLAQYVKTTSGASYLWWLNGVNRGSSVAPTQSKRITLKDETGKTTVCYAIAWDMTKSGLDDNNVGDRFSICNGMTIFGLTSSTGTTVIHHIGFHSSMADFEETVNINSVTSPLSSTNVYTLHGLKLRTDVPADRATQGLPQGIYIVGDKKVAVE